MKRITKIIVFLIALCAASMLFAACSANWETPYDRLEKDGYTARVRYDINGGQFASQNNKNVVDVISAEKAKQGVKLLEPGSDARGEEAKELSDPSRSGYFLAGWYAKREPRTDAQGNPLDEYGVPIAESHRSQGWTYSDKWNFDTDLFQVDEPNPDDADLTLYAAWVPNFTFTFYTEIGEGKWDKAHTYTLNPLLNRTLALPYWEDEQEGAVGAECSGEMTYGSFPKISDKTFNNLYTDSNKTHPVEGGVIEHTGSIDEATGTSFGHNMDFYIDLLDGEWFHIYTAEQFARLAKINGCYELFDDITFTKTIVWSVGLARGDFSGKIYGNNHKIIDVAVTQTDYGQLRGGLFGRIVAKAEIKDVAFVNVSYKLIGARVTGGEFGLFAGNIDSSAKLENVSVQGAIHIGNLYNSAGRYDNYLVGLLSSNAPKTREGVTADITCEIDAVVSGTSETYPHQVTVEKDGILSFSQNENPNTKPEVIWAA